MKMHRIVTYFVDHEDYGLEDHVDMMINMRYIHPRIGEHTTVDIGEWTDDHILNQCSTPNEVYESYFKD